MAPRRSDRRRPWNGVGEPAPVASGNAVGEPDLRGFAIWWPANVIGDGMPLFFKTGTGDGHVWKTSAAGAILLALFGGPYVEVAAFIAGFTGSAATCVVWGVATATTDVKFLAVGMTLSAVLSSGMVLAVGGAVLRDRARGTPACGSSCLLPEPTGVVTADYVPHARYAALYAIAYAIPGLLPELKLSSLEYKAMIAVGTGHRRLFAAKVASPYALPMAAAAAAMIGTTFPVKLTSVALFYAVRGGAVMATQLTAKPRGALGVAGQVGAGAAVTALSLLNNTAAATHASASK